MPAGVPGLPGVLMIRAWLRWLRYKRAYRRLVSAHQVAGYRLSPETRARYDEQARISAGAAPRSAG